MTRGRKHVAAAAAVVLALVAWLLLRGGSGEADRTPAPEGGSESATSRRNPSDAPPPDSPASPGPVETSEPAAPSSAATAAAAGEHRALATCALEDGTPLAGVRFGIRSGPPDVDQITGAGGSQSDSEGRYELRWRASGDRPVVWSIFHPHAGLVSAQGAVVVQTEEDSTDGMARIQVLADDVGLVFRDNPGTAHVRLVDADTDKPVTNVEGLRVIYRIPRGTMSYVVTPDPGLGGWIPLPEGRLPEVGDDARDSLLRIDVATVVVELAMPGFEKASLPLSDVRGRREVRVRPVPPDATGEVVNLSQFDVEVRQNEFIADPPESVSTRLRWTGPDPAPATTEVLGLPTHVGKFALYGLPSGPWHLEVAATTSKNTVTRGGRNFEFRGATVDLGKIELRDAGKVALRVVDSAGEGIPQAWAVVVRPEEDPGKARRLDLDEQGVTAVGDLEPGVVHRAIVKGLPRELEQAIQAKTDAKPVEFVWPEKLVPCRIALIVDGRAVANADGRKTIPAAMQESPLPRDKGAWGADGTFEAKLVPGTYRFSALATPKEGGDLALFAGEVTVPAGDAFETRLELKREAK